MLAMYVKENQRDWDVHIPKVMLAYRSSVHETTKLTPYYTLFGRDVQLPPDAHFSRPTEPSKDIPGYVAGLRERLTTIGEFVRSQT